MIRAKLVIRNVFGKPLRSAIIILSLAAAAFAALFCISGINLSKNGLTDFFTSNYGDADVIITNVHDSVTIKIEDLPQGSRLLGQTLGQVSITVPNSKYLNYVSRESINVVGIDTQLAYEMRFLQEPAPTEGGITLTEPLAKKFSKKAGDELTFYNKEGISYTFKILKTVPANRFLRNMQMAILTTPEVCREIQGIKQESFQIMYADIPGDNLSETLNMLREKHPDHYFFGSASADSEDTMDSMLNIYYLIFAVVFLMICFITVSMSKHIVNERMSVIGMLRSIGGSVAGTGLLLLAESAFYGLCGGILGTLLFLPMRGYTDLGFFAVDEDIISKRSDGITIGVILLVILAVILIQCLFSAAAIIKAAKTPVRDIIFGTKETAYQPSKVLTIVGGVLLAIGIVLFCLFDDFTMVVGAAFCSAVGAVLLYPQVMAWITKGLSALFEKLSMPVAKLAVKECASTKSSISSAQLILSAISLTIAVLIISVSVVVMLASPIYQSDLILQSPKWEGKTYDSTLKRMEGVKDIEKLYYKYLQYDTKATVNDEEREIVLMGYDSGGFRYFSGIRNCPAALGTDEAAIDGVLARKLGLGIGDTFKLGVKIESYMPVEQEFRISALVDAGYFNSMGNTILINLNVYQSLYYDEPTDILIKTEPGKAFQVLNLMRTTLAEEPMLIKTIDQFQAEMAENSGSLLTIIYAIVILGFALSLMGTASNMLMGFEQSRRKYAVYYSSSMSKGKLKKLILLETVMNSGISVILAMVFGMYFLGIIDKALTELHMSVPLVSPVLYSILFGVVSFVVVSIVVIKPIHMLSKMNIAEEIKTSAD